MNTVWSDYVQGIDTLYFSRKNRFDDAFKQKFTELFGLNEDASFNALEIGCGPGALCEALKRWYPKAEITGLDRDSAFIDFAKQNIVGVSFVEGDATKLPFPNASLDVTISNTVSEHVEPSGFFSEQYRVLKTGGVCLLLSARKGITVSAECENDDETEIAFWEKAAKLDDSREKYSVCRYPMNESEMARAMEKYGFTNVTTGYVVSDMTPDDPKFEKEFSVRLIESRRLIQLDYLLGAKKTLSGHFDKSEFSYIESRINQKYDERLRLFENGVKQWDTQVSLTMVLRGIKP